MTIFYDASDFDVLEFYTYPTCVVGRLVEFEDRLGRQLGDEDVKEFFEDCLKVAEAKLGRHLMDNKIAMKIRYKHTNTILYVGYKDNIWCVGLELNKYMTGTKIVL